MWGPKRKAKKRFKRFWNRKTRNTKGTDPRSLRIKGRRNGGLWVERKGTKGGFVFD